MKRLLIGGLMTALMSSSLARAADTAAQFEPMRYKLHCVVGNTVTEHEFSMTPKITSAGLVQFEGTELRDGKHPPLIVIVAPGLCELSATNNTK